MVLGVGNILCSDEGIGVHVAQALKQNPADSTVALEVIDGGTSPDIIHILSGVDKLIIVDAVRGGGKPGTVYRFTPEDIRVETKSISSFHELGILDSLKLVELTGSRLRRTVIIGVEPRVVEWGLGLSPELEERIPEILRVVLEEVEAVEVR